jgi:hypothetical protein
LRGGLASRGGVLYALVGGVSGGVVVRGEGQGF